MPKTELPSFLPKTLRSLADTLQAMPTAKTASSDAPTAEGRAVKSGEGDAVDNEDALDAEAENKAVQDVIIILLKGGEM